MAVIIVEPDITEEENRLNWQQVIEALKPIAKEIHENVEEDKEQ